ncbi:MAG: tellurite resistance TerB family protein [Pseudomonadota bacterium]
MSTVLSPQDTLIAAMMLMSAADRDMADSELRVIGMTVDLLPVFSGYDRDRIGRVSQTVVDLLQNEDGLETLIGLIRQGTPEPLRETVYAVACDVAAADGEVQQEEARLLEMIRHSLRVDRLAAAAIERGAKARHTKAP